MLGRWDPRFGTPVWALVLQGALSLVIVVVAGSFIETILYTAPLVWMYFGATSLAVFVLRSKEPEIARPYRVGGYPVTPLVFCASCLFMLYSSVSYALVHKPQALMVLSGVLAAGLLVYRVTRPRIRTRA